MLHRVALYVRGGGGLRSAGCAVLAASHQPAALLAAANAHLRLADGRLTWV